MSTLKSFGNSTDGELPTDVREQLNKNAVAMSAIQLDYIVTCTGLNGDMPPTSYFEFYNDGHIYQRCQSSPPSFDQTDPKQIQIHDYSFDGEIFWSGDAELKFHGKVARNPAILLKSEARDATNPDYTVPYFRSFYLNCAGFYAPQSMADISKSSSIESLVLHYLRESDLTKIEKNGENLKVTVHISDPLLARVRQLNLEHEINVMKSVGTISEEDIRERIGILKRMQEMIPMRTIIFVLDPKQGYAVVNQEELTDKGQHIVQIQSNQLEYHQSANVWLPTQCILSYYTNPDQLLEFADKPSLTATVELKNIEFDFQNKVEFVLSKRSDYKNAGTIIVDRTTPEARARPDHKVSYMLAADGKLLLKAAGNASHNMSRGKRVFWFCVLLIMLGLPPIVFFINRKI
jgi:hypothetical protein